MLSSEIQSWAGSTLAGLCKSYCQKLRLQRVFQVTVRYSNNVLDWSLFQISPRTKFFGHNWLFLVVQRHLDFCDLNLDMDINTHKDDHRKDVSNSGQFKLSKKHLKNYSLLKKIFAVILPFQEEIIRQRPHPGLQFYSNCSFASFLCLF